MASAVSSGAGSDSRAVQGRLVPTDGHTGDLFREQIEQLTAATDRAFAVVLGVEWLAGIVLAVMVSPFAWAGARSTIHIHVWAAVLLGGAVVWPTVALAWFHSGRVWTRHVVAIAAMLMTAFFIHLTGGRIETHFMVFGTLAFLAFYRDWKVLLTGTLVVLVDHLLRGWLIPLSVYGVDSVTIWRSVEHAWWVAFEDVFLLYAIIRGNRLQKRVASEKIGAMGQYLLHQRLGGGGMGEVHLAEHRLLKRPCVIKVIRSDLAKDANTLARFEREVHTTARLRHPNTVSIYDYGHLQDGTFFYVMEYLPGLSLQQLVEHHGPQPPERVVHLLRQICGALDEAHRIDLIHRDIKPDNILVCQLGGQYDVAKLFDFGLVQTVDSGPEAARLTMAGTILGTPQYMSPEQVTGESIDRRSDIFSLGAVGYFLLTGQMPFDGPNPLAIMYARLKAPVRRPTELRSDIPEDLEQVILTSMSREPDDRFSNAKQMDRALAHCRCGQTWDEERADVWWSRATAQTPGSEDASTATVIVPPPPVDEMDDNALSDWKAMSMTTGQSIAKLAANSSIATRSQSITPCSLVREPQ